MHSVEDNRGGYKAKTQALTTEEKEAIVEAFSTEELSDQPINKAHAMLMDQGVYIASISSCERILRQVRSAQKVTNNTVKRIKPELVATAPNQVWCWDITWLPSEIAGKYYYLYLVIDMFSRFIVAWAIYTKEDGMLARNLFADAIAEHCPENSDSLLVHADNGRPMVSSNLKTLFEHLKVQSSHSRPHTSNDNAYAESIFATMKGRVLYPEYFASIDAANEFVSKFVEWYNYSHLHSGLDMTTPCSVHYGFHEEVMDNRNQLLEAHRAMNPSRYGSRKKVFKVPEKVNLKHRVTLKKVV